MLETGSAWMVEHGYGEAADIEFCEESGQMDGADAAKFPIAPSNAAARNSALSAAEIIFWKCNMSSEYFDEDAAQLLVWRKIKSSC